jgi:hypothetical protein
MTPEQRHNREDKIISVKRTAIYEAAKTSIQSAGVVKSEIGNYPKKYTLIKKKTVSKFSMFYK